jgi:hypothetical protein
MEQADSEDLIGPDRVIPTVPAHHVAEASRRFIPEEPGKP